MNRLNALEKLKTTVVNDFFKQNEKEIFKILESKETAFQMIFQMEILTDQIKKRQKENPEYNIKHFQFSYLRTGIKEYKIKIFLQGLNEKWYLDEAGLSTVFYLKTCEELLQRCHKQIDRWYRQETFKFEFFDLDNVLMDVASHLAILSFMSFKTHLDMGNIQLDCLKEIDLDPDFEIRAGEYQGEDSTLFKLSESDGEDL